MSITLTAEQRTIFDVFSGKVRYIIPPYQRSYAWNIQHCTELWDDLSTAYNGNKDDGYFLGNMVLAKSTENRDALEVIDGQQRLITLTLLMHALLQFDTDNIDLIEAITIRPSRKNEQGTQRLTTNIFIDPDVICLRAALALTPSQYDEDHKYDSNPFIQNAKYFYQKIKKLKKEDIQYFVDFLLKDVWLLPIQAEDRDPNKARDSALKIFETINNRGEPLSDSDIFKAKLYAKALQVSEHESFVQTWKEFEKICEILDKRMDDIFRTYSHILRGREKITGKEIGLREFFTNASEPFFEKKYKDIMVDLHKIIDTYTFFHHTLHKLEKTSERLKWFQIIDAYSNYYPKQALLVYLFRHDVQENENLIRFCKRLTHLAYHPGIRKKIKNNIYSVIADIYHKTKPFDTHPLNIALKKDDFLNLGASKKGYALLALYCNIEQKAVMPNYLSQVLYARDVKELGNSWQETNYKKYNNTLGNLFISDLSFSSTCTLKKKATMLAEESDIAENRALGKQLAHWTYEDYQAREEKLQKRLIAFFKNSDSTQAS